MLQWGILDNVRKYDPVMLFTWGQLSCKVVGAILTIMTTYSVLVLTNFVPAVAVKRRGQVLFVLTGCKTCVGGPKSVNKNRLQQRWSVFSILLALSRVEVRRTPSVGVKSVNIWGTIGGGSGVLLTNWRWGTKAQVSNRIRDPGSLRPDRWVLNFLYYSMKNFS